METIWPRPVGLGIAEPHGRLMTAHASIVPTMAGGKRGPDGVS